MRRQMLGRFAGLRAAGVVVAAVLSLAGATAAQAACSGFNQVTVSVAPGPLISSYDPFAPGDAIRNLTVTVNNPANAQCDAAITFQRSAGAAATMANGGVTLAYSVERVGGGSLITTTGYTTVGTPPAGNRVDLLNIPARGSASANIQLRIPAGQVTAAASYTDNIILQVLRLNQSNQPNLIMEAVPFSPQAGVISKCVMPAPSQPAVNFSSAISNGRPNEGVKQTVTFTNVQCTAPTKLRLTGQAMQPTPATPPRAGFDNFINYRAAGAFGNATSTLSTTISSASADSVQKNAASGATTNGQIDVELNLVNGQPIIAGTYSGTLTVSIDPSF